MVNEMFRTLVMVLAPALLFAVSMHEADSYYEAKVYDKAYRMYEEIARTEKKRAAALKLAHMSEEGLGVEQNATLAAKWYKQAVLWNGDTDLPRTRFDSRIYHNLDPLGDEASELTLKQVVRGQFSLRAYQPNYYVVSYTEPVPRGNIQDQDNYKLIETKLQISLRADYETRLLGVDQMFTAAYTQHSWWQQFINSAPFRETNHAPELFWTVPLYHSLDVIGLKAFSLGYHHVSNGQSEENNTSRSWNRLYLTNYFQWHRLFAELKIWYRIPEEAENDDNPDIIDYYGHGMLKLSYIYDKSLTRLYWRQNFETGRGSAELEFTYPFFGSDNLFVYLQGFTGYGQSLIDYDQYTNQVGLGLSISR
jgi:phospholipase A1